MFNKISVQANVGRGSVYLVSHDKEPEDLHKALTEKFNHEVGMVYITYLEQWNVTELSAVAYGKIEGIITL